MTVFPMTAMNLYGSWAATSAAASLTIPLTSFFKPMFE
jgi:hypothetical protein